LKSNRQAIIDAVNQNKIEITALITNSWKEIVGALHGLQKTADVTLDKVEAIASGVERIQESLLEERPSPSSVLKGPTKPSTFRGESTKIFVGRKQDIETIKEYFTESNLPVSITGEGGIGKSELAYKAMHKCEDMFDLIIPIYFGSHLTFESFLLEMAKSLNLPVDEFGKKSIEERKDKIMNTLGYEYNRALIYADNYETIANVLTIKNGSALETTKEEKEEIDNNVRINSFLEGLPPNTAVLLTSRERYNLDGERPVRLGGLSEVEGRDLFIELARNRFGKGGPSDEIKRALDELSKKTGGHPLSIELLARSFRGEGLTKITEMLEHLGVGVVNPKEEMGRLQSLASCFEYSFNRLPETHRDLLSKLTFFHSPFPADAIEKIIGFQQSEILLDLYDHSLLRIIEFDEYDEDAGPIYPLYYFHPAIRNYLEQKAYAHGNGLDLEARYGEQFSFYYCKLLKETNDAIGKKDHVLSLERFNTIWQGKDNDFERAIKLAKDRSSASSILSYLGEISYRVGRYARALDYHKEALTIDEELNDRTGMSRDYTNLGYILDNVGNQDQALEYHKRALRIDQDLNNRVGMGGDYGNIGLVYYSHGKYKEALEYHNKALEIHQELQHKVRIAEDYANLGIVLANTKNRKAEAIESFSKALKMYQGHKEDTGYHTPLSGIIGEYISELQEEMKTATNHSD
jgi:tetratricopeptide (TPR) repeat protein